MKRHSQPVIQAIVFREGPIPPDVDYIQQILEEYSPDVLRDNAELIGIPLTVTDNLEESVNQELDQLRRAKKIKGFLEESEQAHLEDYRRTRVYIVKILKPGRQRGPNFFRIFRKDTSPKPVRLNTKVLSISLEVCHECKEISLVISGINYPFGSSNHTHKWESISEWDAIKELFDSDEKRFLENLKEFIENTPELLKKNQPARLIQAEIVERLSILEGKNPSQSHHVSSTDTKPKSRRKTEKATYLLVIFNPPGPLDPEKEIQQLIPFLMQQNGLDIVGELEKRCLIEPVSTSSVYEKTTEALKQWLEEEGVLWYQMNTASLNVHGKRFDYLEAAWVESMQLPNIPAKDAEATPVSLSNGEAIIHKLNSFQQSNPSEAIQIVIDLLTNLDLKIVEPLLIALEDTTYSWYLRSFIKSTLVNLKKIYPDVQSKIDTALEKMCEKDPNTMTKIDLYHSTFARDSGTRTTASARLMNTISQREKEAYELNRQGIQLDDSGKHTAAIDCYEKALIVLPCNSEIWSNKGMAHLNINQFQEAISCFDNSINLDQGYQLYIDMNYKGEALMKLNQYEEAVETYKGLFQYVDSKNIALPSGHERIIRSNNRKAIEGVA